MEKIFYSAVVLKHFYLTINIQNCTERTEQKIHSKNHKFSVYGYCNRLFAILL